MTKAYPLIRQVLIMAFCLMAAGQASAGSSLKARPGWIVQPTAYAFAVLNKRLDDAIAAQKMGLVNTASASEGARAQGITIPGNRVVGVFRNDFARRMLAASLAAGIEAPIRFYVTENDDGTATLAYRTPGSVFAPYMDEGGKPLRTLAAELDEIFARIAASATAPP